MRVKMVSSGAHVSWQAGEIVTVQVISNDGDGEYAAETLETYAPDLKEKHAQALTDLGEKHARDLDDLRTQLAEARKPVEVAE